MKRVTRWLLGGMGMLLLGGAARAEVKVAGVFDSHMVLQHGVKLPVWGTAAAGENVTVKVVGQSVAAKAGADGKWRVTLEPLAISATPVDFAVAGTNTIKFDDVLVGDVWLGSGQSNMEYSLGQDRDKAQEVPLADHPDIRLCRVGNRGTLEPLADRDVNWTVCTPQSVRSFSAVCYYFARDVEAATHTPVGIIASSVAGTPGQSWLSLPALKSEPEFKIYLDTYDRLMAESAARAATRPAERNGAPGGLPGALYNGMIHPLAPFALKGFLWYQGESNTSDAVVYRKLLPALIKNWREDWGQGDLPFLIVQLPGNNRRTDAPAHSSWSLVREAEAMTLAVPNTGMAVTLDLSLERQLLHPPNKREVGRRLSLVARRVAYDEKIDESGPTFKSFSIEKDKVRITFDHVGTGLVAGALKPNDPNEPTGKDVALKGFMIAGADERFVYADAVIDGDAVIVSSAQVPTPVAVRYGWEDNPLVTLYNKESLPAAPFRSDDWRN